MTGIDLTAGEAGLRFEADRDGQLRQIGFRPLPGGGTGWQAGPFPVEAFPLAYPAWGQETSAAPALRVTSHDGQAGCYLTLAGHDYSGAEHRIRLADASARLQADLCFRLHAPTGVIEQWTEISHDQPGPVTLHAVAAAAPVLAGPQPWLTRYDADWAAEWTAASAPVPVGTTVIQSFGAIRPHLQASPFFLLAPDGPAAEDAGPVLAGSLAWGGGVRLAFERALRQPALVRLLCGQHPADYRLDPGVVFRTPRMIWAWSKAGTRPLTHRLHRWVREHAMRDGGRLRATVFNTWEAVGFGFDQASLEAMMAGAASLGAELFLLDDGWFGGAGYPRDNDHAGLGDWQPDPAKLPAGVGPLTSAADRHGLRFGLWVEPEMVNPAAALYQAHPDWVVSEPGRRRREQRNQLVLDLCQQPVRAFVADVVDGLLRDSPGISYLKWDANRDISEPGSGALPSRWQANLWADTVHARWQVMREVAECWPDTELMLCASGGGRTDLGTLRWFHEVWLSDNTDAVARLRMQWAASTFLPPQAIAAHVTRWGDQDVAFACAVAMSARFGFDLDPATLTPAELAACQRAAAIYANVRDLVQLGDLFRLISPDAPGGRAALGYAGNTDGAAGRARGRRGVVFGYQLTDAEQDRGLTPCPVPWADREARYRIQQLTLTRGGQDRESIQAGAELRAHGLAWPLQAARTAVIWLVEEMDEK
ncbi:MAG TPA: alpha-galactosidase [Streptosporangiaceae bacterium]